MRIGALRIENFRSIQKLAWTLESSFCCLVGSGDSGKSTVLLALEKVLSPRWNEQFYDVDFHRAEASVPIQIEVDIGDLPPSLLSDEVFGLWIRSGSGDSEHDEPTTPQDAVITIRLRVEESLEPIWTIVNEREPEGRRLSNRERQRFHMMRLGESETRHLAWGRGSALAELGSEGGEVQASLSEATRAARSSVDPSRLTKLTGLAQKAESLFGNLGLHFQDGLVPHLDPSQTWGSLALHDGPIPLKNAGTGTVRLSSLALQLELAKFGGVTLVDEVELGLDPHRLRRLLGVLRKSAKTGTVIVSTHSPVAVNEVGVDHLNVLLPGIAHEVRTPSDDLKYVCRKSPEAFLGRQVLVCEGTTEVGFVMGLSDVWGQEGRGLANGGTTLVDAESCDQVHVRAEQLQPLGLRVAVFADQDKPLPKGEKELAEAGITPFLWKNGLSIENAVFEALSPAGVVAILYLLKAKKPDKVEEGIKSKQVILPADWDVDTTWLSADVRKKLGKAAKAKKWIKETYLAREVGFLTASHLAGSASDLISFLEALGDWISNHDDAA